MKKLVIAILTTIMVTSSSAIAGSFAIGAKVSNTFIEASGTETTTAGTVTGGAANTNSVEVDNMAVIPSLYVEYSLDSSLWGSEGNEITLGANYTFGDADVSDKIKTRQESAEDAAGSGSSGSMTYNAQAVVENYINYYLEVPVAGGLFAKVGLSQIDVITKEDSDHQGSYGNKTLDGENFGFGVKGLSGNLSWKVAYESTNWDSLALTSTTSNKIAADLDVDELALSVGYRF